MSLYRDPVTPRGQRHATRLTSVTEKLCRGMGLRQPDLVTSAQFPVSAPKSMVQTGRPGGEGPQHVVSKC